MAVTINGSGQIAGVPGAILQVVHGTYSTEISKSANDTTFTDTGLTATITPVSSSSKILVLVHQNGLRKSGADVVLRLRLLRDATAIAGWENSAAGSASTATIYPATSGVTWIDQPGTTSPVTYKTQYASNAAQAGTLYLQMFSSISSILLMELAA